MQLPLPLATQFHSRFKRLDDFEPLKWMADHDPGGHGRLDKSSDVITFLFTDGSEVYLDLKSRRFYLRQH